MHISAIPGSWPIKGARRRRRRYRAANLRPKFEEAIERLSSGDLILPGRHHRVPSRPLPGGPPGEVIELEISKIGTLRTRAV